jgi:hypothetical protein
LREAEPGATRWRSSTTRTSGVLPMLDDKFIFCPENFTNISHCTNYTSTFLKVPQNGDKIAENQNPEENIFFSRFTVSKFCKKYCGVF